MKHSWGTRIQDRLGQKLGFGVYVYQFPLTGDFFIITFNTNQTKNILKVFWLNDTKNSVCCKILTLFPMGYLKGFSSSHTQMKTTRENTLLVYSTSILEVVNVYTMKSQGLGGVVGSGEGFFRPFIFENSHFFYRLRAIQRRSGKFVPHPPHTPWNRVKNYFQARRHYLFCKIELRYALKPQKKCLFF